MVLLRCSSFVLILWILIDTSGSNGDNVNPCAYTTCPSGTTCKVEPGNCQSGKCPLQARCASPCDTIRCRGDQQCVSIYVNCLEGSTDCKPGLQGKCVPKQQTNDPCETYTCPEGQGCYLKQNCSGYSCQMQPFCQDPCLGVKCPEEEFCYPEKVTCIKAPCNPIPTCKKPCDTLNCPPSSKCVIPKIGIPCQKPPCRPHPICQADKTN